MNEPQSTDPDDFQKELEILRSILQENLQHAKQNPPLGTQLEFWLESARFLELNIKIWDQVGNEYEENRARERMRRVLDILQELVNQMNEERGDGKANPEA
jgi:hypothetical protein